MQELIKLRRQTLNKENDQPHVVVVTDSLLMDLKHTIWTTQRRKLVATSRAGYSKIIATLILEFPELKVESETQTMENLSAMLLDKYQLSLKAFPGDQVDCLDHVDLSEMAKFLKKDWKINSIDISAGPTLISLLMKEYVNSHSSAKSKASRSKKLLLA
jgi:riboflavin biosynthesis pyrimidine reductase